MKKTFKKLFAALLAAALVLAMAVPAFAEDENGMITIRNAVDGMTYNFYRILDIDTHTDNYSGVVYKTNDTWSDFISTFAKSTQAKNYLTVGSNGVVSVDEKATTDSTFAEAFASAAQQYLSAHNEIQADYSVSSAQASNGVTARLGYYLVASTGWTDGHEVICSLDTTKPNVTINEKNGKPTIEKKIVENGDPSSSNDASIGDVIKFQTTVKVVDGDPKGYTVHDKMSAGLSFNGKDTLSVTVDGKTLDKASYTVNTTGDDCTFDVVFHDVDDKSVLPANATVVITYYATVTSDAVIGGSGNTNETKLTYRNNTDTEYSTTTTYVWSFDLFKYTGDDTPLSGAVFQVLDSTGKKTAYFKETNGVYKFAGWEPVEGAVNQFTTPDDGKIKFEGLDSGTYQLKEITAPEGYNLLENAIIFTISGVDAGNPGTVSYGDATGSIRVLNNAGALLPSTGGMGTTLFYVIGGGLMVTAVVLLVTKKRMEHKN